MWVFGIYLWLFHGLSIGYYHPFFLLGHIPLWHTGYRIRNNATSPKARWTFLGMMAAAILILEFACNYWFVFSLPIILLTAILDLLIGYFFKDVVRPIRLLIDWIKKDET